jgi:diguanylate cyclase (GGDEF)-like protein
MPLRAHIYVAIIVLSGLACAVAALPAVGIPTSQWQTFIVLTILATFAQLYVVEAHGHVSYHPSPIFVYAGVLLLDPALYTALVVIYLGIEWLKERMQNSHRLNMWYIQPFNMAVDILAGTSARWIYQAAGSQLSSWHGVVPVIVGGLAALCFVFINHSSLGLVIVLAQRKRWRETGMLTIDTAGSDLILLLLGYVLAVLWQINPWLILPALSPIILMYRALRVTALEEEAQTDSKTGLLNARYFDRRFKEEFERAVRFNRPMAYVMADLDLLRLINNGYGHLAGDQVLAGVSAIIKQVIRDFDIAGRFGGEEFCIIMLEAGPDEALLMAERIRSAVEQASFKVATHPEPIRVTMSLGVACYPSHGQTEVGLSHEADMALYRAKGQGRNQVCLAAIDEQSALRTTGIYM